jgi:hypothetical protein
MKTPGDGFSGKGQQGPGGPSEAIIARHPVRATQVSTSQPRGDQGGLSEPQPAWGYDSR